MSNDLHAEGKRNNTSIGCMVMMIIIALTIVGLLGWILLWGRSIPAGEESQSSPPQVGQIRSLYLAPNTIIP